MNAITFPASVLALALVLPAPSAALAQNFNSSANVEFKASRDRDRAGHYRRHADRYDRRDWRGNDRRSDRDHHRDHKPGKDDYAGPSGTYVGGFSAYYDRGNGTYFYIDRDGGYRPAPGIPAVEPGPGAKLIDPHAAGNPCSMEAGVCIIRPGN